VLRRRHMAKHFQCELLDAPMEFSCGRGNRLTCAARMRPSGFGNFAGVLTVSHYSTNSATIS
jgi:hypothetical protein